MTYFRHFSCKDLLQMNNVNLDPLTETYGISFYMHYLAKWPEYFVKAENPAGDLMGYIMGKIEGRGADWHGHVTALSVAHNFRRLQLGGVLMNRLEQVTDNKKGFFVDLFVRKSNEVAVSMYTKLGYEVFRTVLGYYTSSTQDGDDEDAFDMRKCMSRDVNKVSLQTDQRFIRPEELHF